MFKKISEYLQKIKTIKNLKKEKQIIGFLGRVCEDKGIDHFLNLAELRKDVLFIIAGPIESFEIKNKIKEKEIIR